MSQLVCPHCSEKAKEIGALKVSLDIYKASDQRSVIELKDLKKRVVDLENLLRQRREEFYAKTLINGLVHEHFVVINHEAKEESP